MQNEQGLRIATECTIIFEQMHILENLKFVHVIILMIRRVLRHNVKHQE